MPRPLFGGGKKDEEPELDARDDNIGGERERVLEWRVAEFEALGLPYPVALELAINGADMEQARQATAKGATPEQMAAMFL
jgi:hypothetical protein